MIRCEATSGLPRHHKDTTPVRCSSTFDPSALEITTVNTDHPNVKRAEGHTCLKTSDVSYDGTWDNDNELAERLRDAFEVIEFEAYR